ncbi:N/A [soil metagenome]
MGATKNLVLGGSGLIGAALCKHLEQLGEEVINIDIKNGSEFDLRSMDLYAYKDADYVWFLAWDVGGAKYLTAQKNLLNILHNNTLLCERVFSFLESTQIPFLFATTQLADANNTYGITKILGEEWTKLLGGKTARFWNVYGWEEPGERSHVIPDFVVQALEKGSISMMTSGVEKRQFIHAEDCARNLVRIRQADMQDVDLTNGGWNGIGELATIIANKTGAVVQPGPAKGYENILEPSKMLDTFTFEVTLEEGLNKIIEEGKKYLKHKKE